MKATGVIRRIDDLGRIVIPKEIRKTLRVKDGESLEIYLENDNIVLKKYFPLEGSKEFYKSYVESINDLIGHCIIMVDRDSIIAVSGEFKKKYTSKKISTFIDNIIEGRLAVFESDITDLNLSDDLTEKASYVIAPIITDADAIGAVIILSSTKKLDEFEEKIAIIAAKFLGKYIE